MSEHPLISVPQSIVCDGVRFAMNQFGPGQNIGVTETLRLAPQLHPANRGLLIRYVETELSYVTPDDEFHVRWSPVVTSLHSAPPPRTGGGANDLTGMDERFILGAVRFALGLGRDVSVTHETATALTAIVAQLTVESLDTIAPLITRRLCVERQPVMSWDDVAPWDAALRTINERLGEPDA